MTYERLRQRTMKPGLHRPVAGKLARNKRAPCPDLQGLTLLDSPSVYVPFLSIRKMDENAACSETSGKFVLKQQF